MLFADPLWATVVFFFCVCEVVKRNIRLTCNLSDCVVLVKSYIYFIYNPIYIYICEKSNEREVFLFKKFAFAFSWGCSEGGSVTKG